MSAPDEYDFWRRALAGETIGGSGGTLPIHDGDAHPGFYRRTRTKGGPWIPCAIFRDEGSLVCLLDGREVDAAEQFGWVCRNPITEAAYHRAVAGGGWADDPQPVEPEKAAPAPAESTALTLGAIDAPRSNLPSDPFESLTIEFAGDQEAIAEVLAKPITDQAAADRAALLAKRLGTYSTRATDQHKVEKAPSLIEGRRVDDKWRDLKDLPASFAAKLKRHLDAFLIAERKREADRVAEAERVAKVKAAEAAATAAAAFAIGDQTMAAEAETLAEDASIAKRNSVARPVAAGRTGAKVSLRTVTFAKITDFDKLLVALKARPEIIELVETLANRAARNGVVLDGMTIENEQRAA